MINKIFNAIVRWLPIAVAVTLLCGIIYATVQQTYRQNANDPQIQMAEDTATALANGQTPDSLIGTTKVDMATGLAPYLIIFDATGKPIASSVLLDGKIPMPPLGIFDYTKQHGQDRITWQPRAGIRSAAIIVPYSGTQSGFVLAGRSLREAEQRVENLGSLMVIGWALSLAATLFATFLTTLGIKQASPIKQ